MLTSTSIIPQIYSIRTHQRFRASDPNPRFLFEPLQLKKKKLKKSQFLGNWRLDILNNSVELHHEIHKRDMTVYSGVDPGPVLPSDPSGSWKVWIAGMIIAVVLPFCRNKWWPLIKLKDRFESAVETAEELTDIVEKVAEGVEKVAEEVGDHLPEGGKLKEAVAFVENVAKETAKDAHLAEEVLEKVEEVGKETEALIETIIDQASELTKEAKDQR